MTGDLPFQPDPFPPDPFPPDPMSPDDFDPFAGFTGGMDEPGHAPLHLAPDLFDTSGLALQFGPPPAGGLDGVDGVGDHGPGPLSWYDAPHPW